MAKEKTDVAVQEDMIPDIWDVEDQTGLEGASSQDMMRPFVSILQANSPQCKRSEGAYIEGAHEGHFFNMATGMLYEDSFDFIPCFFRKSWIEWTPRDSGGGFVAEYMTLDGVEVTQDSESWGLKTLAGNDLQETASWNGILVYKRNAEPVIVSMVSTQLKKSRKLMSELKMLKVAREERMVNPPAWFSTYTVTTMPENNEHGSWMGWKLTRKGHTHVEYDLEYIEMAKELLSMSQ